jgi:hypothetical protein
MEIEKPWKARLKRATDAGPVPDDATMEARTSPGEKKSGWETVTIVAGLVFSLSGNVFQFWDARHKVEELRQKDRELAQKDSELTQKAQEHNLKARELSQKDRDLTQKDSEFTAKQAVFDKRCSALQKQMVGINDELMRIRARKRAAESAFNFSGEGTQANRLTELQHETNRLNELGLKTLAQKQEFLESTRGTDCPINPDDKTPGWPPKGM